MRKIILYIAASLDGFIARPDGNIDWLHDEDFALPGEDFHYSSFLETIDTTLMGNSTYQVIQGFETPFPYTDKTNYVFTRNPEHQDDAFVKFVSSDATGFIKELKQQPGKDIWLIGGGQLNTLVLEAGLLDEIVLTYIPILLGTGIPLFAAGLQEHKLQVESNHCFDNGFVQLTLRPAKSIPSSE
ncbi:dihydrofolate reductase [Pontibacter qinzhouensis]|uniref:Dihydrofolate reductase n=1 Tax=Pontibacter qinzhouensis TaxID=2603253 RepID=A0A5C8K6Z5_9BACT|nr:dihydrofolate reductase family protein [Pontibacter qinzhouensis]TXK46446.1 dihydrofolate reductase [Pontibacter qinzhouensis]